MNESTNSRSSTYTTSPVVPAEVLPRLAVIVQVLSGEKSVSQAAREMNLSRNHFQSILHRSLAAMIETLVPKEPGRHPKPQALSDLERRLRQLERENTRLKRRVAATDELLQVAGQLLHGQPRPARRARKRATSADPADAEPEPHAQVLQAVDRMIALGLTRTRAAWLAGVDTATVRRWRAPVRRRIVRSTAASAWLRAQAQRRVRELHGLIGAAALSHGIAGLSRRAAARVKTETLTLMERERQHSLKQVHLSAIGAMRGVDAMHLPTEQGSRYALIAADSAVPYRTSVAVSAHYDAALVARLLEQDIAQHGAPLVLRADRARAHEAPEVRAILDRHQILLLHGPPRYPRFYGQLERQNREHRAWLDAIHDPLGPALQQLLAQMLHCLNTLWPRRRLSWRTPAEMWHTREPISPEIRARFLEEVHDRRRRLACKLIIRGAPADLAERLAIEQALSKMRYLHQQIGDRC